LGRNRFVGHDHLFHELSKIVGEYPFLNREISEDDLDVIEDLLAGKEIKFELVESVTYSECATSITQFTMII
jgi:hypothetical protein